MTANSWKFRCLGIALAPLAIAVPLEAKPVLTILPANSEALSVNDNGVVVGQEYPGLGFVRTPDGTMTTFKAVDDAGTTVPLSINNSGVIAGAYTGNGQTHGFVRDVSGAVTSFDGPGAGSAGTSAVSINARGVIAGYYYDPADVQHGFVRTVHGAITSFDVPGAAQTAASGINDKGEIAGTWSDPLPHGFVRSADGTITSFDVPAGAMGTYANAIDGRGAVAGYYLDQAKVMHGYVRQSDGTFTTFDVGTGPSTYVTAMNAKGEVAGWGSENENRFLGFVRHPNGNVFAIDASRYDIAPLSINKDGVVAGLARRVRHVYVPYGFIWTP